MLSDKQCVQIRAAYEKRELTSVIAARYRVGRATILRAVRRAGGIVRNSIDINKRFSDEQCTLIKDAYENGTPASKLAERFSCTSTTILSSIRRIGGRIHAVGESQKVFTPQQDEEIRKAHDGGQTARQIAKRLQVSHNTINRAVVRAGGTIRSRKKYIRNPIRERAIFSNYGATVFDLDFLHTRQRGLCLWCSALLPIDSLACSVDHIGGKSTFGQRSKIRGLCCPDNICNILAGRIEANGFTKNDWGLQSELVRRIKHVLKTNHGNLFKEQR